MKCIEKKPLKQTELSQICNFSISIKILFLVTLNYVMASQLSFRKKKKKNEKLKKSLLNKHNYPCGNLNRFVKTCKKITVKLQMKFIYAFL